MTAVRSLSDPPVEPTLHRGAWRRVTDGCGGRGRSARCWSGLGVRLEVRRSDAAPQVSAGFGRVFEVSILGRCSAGTGNVGPVCDRERGQRCHPYGMLTNGWGLA